MYYIYFNYMFYKLYTYLYYLLYLPCLLEKLRTSRPVPSSRWLETCRGAPQSEGRCARRSAGTSVPIPTHGRLIVCICIYLFIYAYGICGIFGRYIWYIWSIWYTWYVWYMC